MSNYKALFVFVGGTLKWLDGVYVLEKYHHDRLKDREKVDYTLLSNRPIESSKPQILDVQRVAVCYFYLISNLAGKSLY